MEQIFVKIEPEELVDDSVGDILLKYDIPSTSADQEMPSLSGIAVKHEIKEESDDDEVLLNKGLGSMMYYVGSKTNDSEEESEDFDHKIKDFLCNIKEEERYSDFSEEDDTNLSNNEEKDEDEAMIEAKIEVEYHGLECYESGADSEVVNKETPSKTEEKGFEKNPGYECKGQLGLSREKECLKARVGVGEVKLFECDICPKKYKTRRSLTCHKKYVHEKDNLKELKCGHCAFVTANRSNLNVHLKIHDKEKYLRCNFCEFMTTKLYYLNAHIISRHKSENKGENKIKITSKIYQCSNCSYSAVYKSSYDAHIKVCLKLENVQQYECHLCHYKTIHKFGLKKHMKIHNKTKEFKCLFCPKESNHKYNLDGHILTKHSHLLNESNRSIITSKVHSCHLCNYKTTNIGDLKKHINRHTQ
ncbi:unnamed protein product, partial [Brassicogethes aeneus]